MPALAYAEAPTAAPVPDVLDRGPLDRLAAGDDATWHATVRRYEGLLRSAALAVDHRAPGGPGHPARPAARHPDRGRRRPGGTRRP